MLKFWAKQICIVLGLCGLVMLIAGRAGGSIELNLNRLFNRVFIVVWDTL